MEETKNKGLGKNILIGVLIFLLGLSLFYIGYDKFLKKDKIPEQEEVKEDIKENNYEIFKENAIANRNKYYDSTNKKYFYTENEFQLTATGELYYSNFENSEKEKIASNVLSFEFVHIGNGGFKYLYFIKEDGSVSSANYYIDSQDNRVKKDNDIKITDNIGNYKNIVAIIDGGVSICGEQICSDSGSPMFIDINGKMYNQDLD